MTAEAAAAGSAAQWDNGQSFISGDRVSTNDNLGVIHLPGPWWD